VDGIASGRVAPVVAVLCRRILLSWSAEEICLRRDFGQSRLRDATPVPDSHPVGEVILGHPGHGDGICGRDVGRGTQQPAFEALHHEQESESRERAGQREDQHALALHERMAAAADT
jgi:hypothetical protein